ncbi:hypothetical protein LXA43DRAFT_902027 [Ganoderma leucocontextum]|nr:hypothetical protein LXA43DRAFT_902027 [Ganoderma leucocontextum]
MAGIQANRDAVQDELVRAIARENDTHHACQTRKTWQKHDHYFRAILKDFATRGIEWGDFVEWVSQPASRCRDTLWLGFFINQAQVTTVLDLWCSKNSSTGKATMRAWATKYLGEVLEREANRATNDGVLLTRRMAISEAFVTSFNLRGIHSRIFELCPTATDLMRSFCTTRTPQEERIAKRRQDRRELRVGTALVDLLGQRSQNNSYVRYIMGLYLYATGAARQTLSLLSSLNVSSSYSALVGNKTSMETAEGQEDGGARGVDDSDAPASLAQRLHRVFHRGAGLLRKLSTSRRTSAATCAQTRPFGNVYDNINMMFKIAEQILGRKDSQENGTCATIFPLQDADPADMKTSDMLATFDAAPPLSAKDIRHTPEESKLFKQSLEHAILREVVHRCPLFDRFRADVNESLPATDDKILVHQTEVYPLPAMHIDESSTTGNAEVLDTIFTELGFDIKSPEFAEDTRPTFGDQLSISRLRSIITNRAGHDTAHRSYSSLVFGPGFFHHQMAFVHGIFETHWGDPNARTQNPASLHFFNTSLDRKPIVLSSLPPYRVCRDLIFTTLTATLLHCLELVSCCESLEDYATNVTFEELREHCGEILKTYASPSEIPAPHSVPGEVDETEPLQSGDMIFENMSLFLRDALIMREFNDAIKSGYSGRIIRVLKMLALIYRGSGRTKYAYEMLHLIHNLTHLWPTALRNIMIKNWLVNPTGKEDAWVPVDLLQEHMNFWVKVIYKAQGSNASWEWLEMISPCVALLRKLATQINESLGARLGSTSVKISILLDYETIRNRLREYNVLIREPGRVIYQHDPSKGETPNVVTAGHKQLQGPLNDYNRAFRQLQRQRSLTPLVGSA